ncbi:Trypsin domain containing protein [Trichuris trichiura]|uniref:Trypsin domain containing protein n=1 Tax=Trichuris trichiura TaxID=36087 RepID=A0A077ZA46_TRITR|nr:Trypsin domain containing protein [Trichuris trichiura]
MRIYSLAICGKPYFDPASEYKRTNRIVRGFNAVPHSHPWQALIYVAINGTKYKCGGSLIDWNDHNSSDLVLTAAHCVIDMDAKAGVPLVHPEDVHVYFGIHNLKRLKETRQIYAVTHIIPATFHEFNKANDIAILKLDRNVYYNKYVQGICLPSINEELAPQGGRCFVTGWGSIGKLKSFVDAFCLHEMEEFTVYTKVSRYLDWMRKAICGKPYFDPSPEYKWTNRIIRGFNAVPHSHPWQALIYITINGLVSKCGGSLIDWDDRNSSDLVLTAAHCVIDTDQFGKSTSRWEELAYHVNRLIKKNPKVAVPLANPEDVDVYFGVHHLKGPEDTRQKRAVTHIIPGIFHEFNKKDDIAILKLDRKVNYNKYIQGICLPSIDEKFTPYKGRCFVTGWGSIGELQSFLFYAGNGQNPKELQQFEVSMYDGKVHYSGYKEKNMLCHRMNLGGSAEGDSGGPLACLKDDKYVLYGIISFSVDVSCLRHMEEFAVFTKVSRYLDWMKKAICGKPYFDPVPEYKRTNRIVRGFNAVPHSHPWQALIYVTINGRKYKCGGSLIDWNDHNSSDLVLTAAHCVIDTDQFRNSTSLFEELMFHVNRLIKWDAKAGVPLANPKDVKVYFGAHNIKHPEDTRQKYAVTHIIPGTFNEFNEEDDIAILKLNRKVNYNKYIQGICLPSIDEELPPQGGRCFVTGWGSIGNGQNPDELQQFEVSMYDGNVHHSGYNKKNMLCSRKNEDGIDEGDSGGPLACLKDSKYVLYGIISFSVGVCGLYRMQEFAVFTKVTKYLNWMRKVIPTTVNHAICGKPYFDPVPKPKRNNRIVDGFEAVPHSHPWQAVIYVNMNGSLSLCGGSLIDWNGHNSSDLILTAAHCVIDIDQFRKSTSRFDELKFHVNRLIKRDTKAGVPLVKPEDVHVYVGAHNIKKVERTRQEYPVTLIIPGTFHEFNEKEDIAILKLGRKSSISRQILCSVSLFYAGNQENPDKLQQFEVSLYDGKVRYSGYNKNNMLCHRMNKGGSAEGDSGGPLACMKDDKYVIYGIISFSVEAICGKPYFDPVPEYKWNNRIVRGFKAVPHSHPWQALIYVTTNGTKYKCGGSLIDWNNHNSSDLVLTAAHCIIDIDQFGKSTSGWEELVYHVNRLIKNDPKVAVPLANPEDVDVYFGAHNIKHPEDTRQKYAVTHIIPGIFHEFDKKDDIAILKLDRKVNYNKYIQGICLPSVDEELAPQGGRCFVTGWGTIGKLQFFLFYSGNGQYPNELQQFEVSMHDGKVRYSGYNKKNMLCSRKNGGGIDQGDSGGPLACLKDNRYVLYGIISFSVDVFCLYKSQEFAVFTKVSRYLNWMRKVIPTIVNHAICGKPYFDPIPLHKRNNRIVHGFEAVPHSHPWQAAIYVDMIDSVSICGGSLIDWNGHNSSDLVLTAAHCVIDTKAKVEVPLANPENVTVYLGAHNLGRLENTRQEYGVTHIIAGAFNEFNEKDDIAILKLGRKVYYNKYIQGICLPSINEEAVPKGSRCFVTGWGTIGNEQNPDELQQFEVSLYDGKVRYSAYNKKKMLCHPMNEGGCAEAVCGKPHFDPLPEHKRNNRILHGFEAVPHSHPWQAVVYVNINGPLSFCGGSLIDWNDHNSSDLVLTAAHCVIDTKGKVEVPLANPENVTVYLGAHNLKRVETTREKYAVTHIIPGAFHEFNEKDDIAILKLGRKVYYNKYIQGICLPSINEEIASKGSRCFVTGWGRTGNGRNPGELQQLEVSLYGGIVQYSGYSKKKMLCHRMNEGGSAQGDSGGPLACLKDNKFVLYGIISFSVDVFCLHEKEEFGVFTKAVCGKPYFDPVPVHGRNNRIVHGFEAVPHSHPWQALIYVNINGSLSKCGGSLIDWNGHNSSDLVLTAAHCVIYIDRFRNSISLFKELMFHLEKSIKRKAKVEVPLANPENVTVYLGAHNLKRVETTREKYAVTHIIPGTYHKFNEKDDIAILNLFYTGNGRNPDELQQLEVSLYGGKVLYSGFNKKNTLHHRKDEGGSAEGDSGGPLACLKDNKFVLYGIISFSIDVVGFDKTEEFSVFTEVSKYLNWMREVIPTTVNYV